MNSTLLQNVQEQAYLLYWNDLFREQFEPNTILLCIYLLIGIPGNIAIIFVYQVHLRKSKEKDGRYFIVPLALIDTAALIITGSFNLSKNIHQVTFPGNATCKFLIYSSYMTTCTSLFLLNAIAVQRYLKICRPFGRQMTLKWKRFSIFFCATSSAILYIPTLVYYGVVETKNPKLFNVTGFVCNRLPASKNTLRGLKIFNGIGFTITICNVAAITILYIIITISIVKQMKRMKFMKVKATENTSTFTSDEGTTKSATKSKNNFNSGTSENETSVNSVSQIKNVKIKKATRKEARNPAFTISFMFMTISFVGFLAYLPSWIFIVLETNNPLLWKTLSTKSSVVFHVCLALRRMYMVNHLANPFIYGAFDKDFRIRVKKMFRRH